MLSASPAFAQSAFEDPNVVAADGKAATGDLVAVQSKVDGGGIALGSSSQVVMLFRNDSAKPITAGDINLYPSSNVSASVSQNQCSLTPLESGAVCAIALTVKGLQAGKYRIEMLIKHDGRSRLLTASANGDVESSGDTSQAIISDVEAVPSTLDFGTLDESHTMVRSVVLRNITSNPINIEDVRIEANDQSGFNLQSNCAKLETGQACLATISWAPQKKGAATGMLIVEHDGPTGVTSITLDGKYEPTTASAAEVFPEAVPGKGLMISTAEEVDFGSGITNNSSITVSLVNVGDQRLTIQDIRMANNENGISIARSGCRAGVVLDPVEACPLTLNWSPTREGAIVDDVQVRHNGARGILVLPVRGAAAKAINKDSKAIVLNQGSYLGGIPSLLTTDMLDEDDLFDVEPPPKPTSSRSSTKKQDKKTATEEKLPADEESAASDSTGASADGVGKMGGESSSGSDSAAVDPDAPYSPSAASSRDGGFTGRGSESAPRQAAPRQATKASDVQGILDSFAVTSLAPSRAIITGPGGSRVVFDGEEAIIGGVLWTVGVKNSAVEFGNGNQKVLMLFDKSLSSVNRNGGESGSTVVSAPAAAVVATPTP